MSHEGGPEQPQRTVAELLAKYGAESGGSPRRRRRRADDVADTGAQAIIDRVLSESGEMQAISDDMPPPERTSHRRGGGRPDRNIDASTEYAPQVDPRRQPPPASPGQQSSQRLPRPLPPQPSQRLPRPAPGQQSSTQLPGIAQGGPTTPVRGTSRPAPGQQSSQQLPRPQPSQRVPPPASPARPIGGTRDRTGIRSRLDGDLAPPAPPPMAGPSSEATEELPRVPGRIPVDGSMSGRRPVADAPTQYAPAYPYPDEDRVTTRTRRPTPTSGTTRTIQLRHGRAVRHGER